MSILELTKGTLFKIHGQEHTIFEFLKIETDADGVVINVLIRSVAFKMDGIWHKYPKPQQHNCNWCANVTKVTEKLDYVASN